MLNPINHKWLSHRFTRISTNSAKWSKLGLIGFVFLHSAGWLFTIKSFYIKICAIFPAGELALFFQIGFLILPFDF